jgi:hypothetical protein
MWFFQGKEFKTTDIPDNAHGFIYELSAVIDGKSVRYIGKKDFYANIKKNMGKKEIAALTDKRVKKYTRVKKLAYEKYYGSNIVLKEAHAAGIPISRKIIQICFSKTELTYMECKYQFSMGVLESDEFLNGNILGRFYKFK